MPPGAFDLALQKTLADGTNLGTFAPGDTVTFTITVENQGAVDATDVQVVDYLPAGLTLADPNWVDNGDGTANLATPIAALAVGASASVDIIFTIDANASGSINNIAEISAANDADGNPGVDIDSIPDATVGNDNQPAAPNDVTDDETGEDGLNGGDEDDHDIAGIEIAILVVDPPPPTYSVGNQVWFDEDNNGILDPGEAPIAGVWVELFSDTDGDGQPDDLNGDGIIDSNDAIATTMTDANGLYLFDGLEPGDYIVGIPPIEWDAGGPLEGFLSSDPTSVDPNDDVDNDDNGALGAGGYILSGPVTLGDGEPTGEGPDNDPNTPDANENLTVDFGFHMPIFDVALFKTLQDGTNLATVSPGDQVTFTVTLINQGDLGAGDLNIVEYIPAALTLDDPDWTDNGDGTAEIDVPGVVLPGDSVSVDVTFTVNANATGPIDNIAEISEAVAVDTNGVQLTFPNGLPILDTDSTADSSNDDLLLTDDDTSGDGLAGGDEDDHDGARLILASVPPVLALTGVDSGVLLIISLSALLIGALLLYGRREWMIEV